MLRQKRLTSERCRLGTTHLLTRNGPLRAASRTHARSAAKVQTLTKGTSPSRPRKSSEFLVMTAAPCEAAIAATTRRTPLPRTHLVALINHQSADTLVGCCCCVIEGEPGTEQRAEPGEPGLSARTYQRRRRSGPLRRGRWCQQPLSIQAGPRIVDGLRYTPLCDLTGPLLSCAEPTQRGVLWSTIRASGSPWSVRVYFTSRLTSRSAGVGFCRSLPTLMVLLTILPPARESRRTSAHFYNPDLV